MHTMFWSENLKGRDHLEDLGVNGSIILGCVVGCGRNGSGSEGEVAVHCKHWKLSE
jgi:hypothetical protein